MAASSRSPQALSPWIPLLLTGFGILVLTMILLMPMVQQGYPSTHSTHFNLSWGFQYQRQFFSGQFYPRWLEFSNFGFGNATFAFYPPLCMVATLPFRALGLDLNGSLVGSMGLALAVLGWGLYRYGRCYFPGWIALGIAGMGMASPYFLVDIYQRGSIAEVWAITILPWILWATDRTVRLPERFWPLLALGISYGLLVLSHLPTLLIFTLIWIPLPWILAPAAGRIPAAMRCYVGATLAFCWTAFYLWPAALDQRFIQVDSVNALSDYLPQNRLMISGLRQLQPQVTEHWFEKDLWGPWVLMAIAVVLVGGWLGMQTARSRPPADPWRQRAALYWVGGTAFTLLIMTDLLSWIYPLTGILERIQFSWRWLGITTVLLPLLPGYLLKCAEEHRQDPEAIRRLIGTWLALVALGIGAGVVWQGAQVFDRVVMVPDQIQGFVQLSQQKQFPQEPQQRPGKTFIYWHWIFPDGLALVDVPEYRAKGVVMGMPPDRVYPRLYWADPAPDPKSSRLEEQDWSFGRRRFLASHTQDQPQTVMLRTFYYPGWRVQIDGRWVETERSPRGPIQVTLPAGQHQVSVVYWGTAMDWIGRSVSLITLVGVGIGIRRLGHSGVNSEVQDLSQPQFNSVFSR